MNHKKIWWAGSALFLMGLVTGCVLKQEAPLNSRFFSDYSEFQKVDFKAETLVYRHPTTRVIDYSKFMIAPVSVYDNPRKKIKLHNQLPYVELEQELRGKLVQLISSGYQVVTAPGPGVLRLEYAVVDIKPYVWLTRPDGTRYFRTDTVLKGSKFELDCSDSQSEERIFAISTSYIGDQYKAYEDVGLIPNVQSAFDEWAHYLSELLLQSKKQRAKSATADAAAFRPSIAAYSADPIDPSAKIYRHPRLHPLQYGKFYFALPVLHGRSDLKGDARREMRIKLREQAAQIFHEDIQLVNQPGPGVLTVRTTITESTTSYQFALECIDPHQGELVFGMVRDLPHIDLKEAYRQWNATLRDRLEEAQDNLPRRVP